jgi:hypothetical protein
VSSTPFSQRRFRGYRYSAMIRMTRASLLSRNAAFSYAFGGLWPGILSISSIVNGESGRHSTRTMINIPATIDAIPKNSRRVTFSLKKNMDAMNVKTSSTCPSART